MRWRQVLLWSLILWSSTVTFLGHHFYREAKSLRQEEEFRALSLRSRLSVQVQMVRPELSLLTGDHGRPDQIWLVYASLTRISEALYQRGGHWATISMAFSAGVDELGQLIRSRPINEIPDILAHERHDQFVRLVALLDAVAEADRESIRLEARAEPPSAASLKATELAADYLRLYPFQ